MITDEDKVFYRESDDQFIFQYVDGRFYIENECDDFENCNLLWDEENEVYFLTHVNWDWVSDFIKLKGFEEYEPFKG